MRNLKQFDLKTIILTLSTLILAPIVMADEMSTEDKIKSVMSAAPTRIAKNATIQDSDGTILREGSNNVAIPTNLRVRFWPFAATHNDGTPRSAAGQ